MLVAIVFIIDVVELVLARIIITCVVAAAGAVMIVEMLLVDKVTGLVAMLLLILVLTGVTVVRTGEL